MEAERETQPLAWLNSNLCEFNWLRLFTVAHNLGFLHEGCVRGASNRGKYYSALRSLLSFGRTLITVSSLG